MRVPVTDLVGHPGETRALSRAVPPADFGDAPWGPSVESVEADIELDLHLDAVVDGVLVRGSLTFHVVVSCARCLRAQHLQRNVDVTELFTDPRRRDPDDEDEPGYELIDDSTAIDLSTMVRDSLVVDLPVRVLCDEDCRGLCVVCGTDLNRADCGHRPDQIRDPRWAPLAEIDVSEN